MRRSRRVLLVTRVQWHAVLRLQCLIPLPASLPLELQVEPVRVRVGAPHFIEFVSKTQKCAVRGRRGGPSRDIGPVRTVVRTYFTLHPPF